MVKDVAFNEATGVFTITYLNGATITLDTKLEKLAVNFDYDPETQQLIIILDDETEQYVDLSALITVYEFLDSDTIAFSVDDAGKVSAIVKEGSIEEKHLQPNYLADIKVEVAKAESAVESAEELADLAKSYAVGTDGAVREGDSTDNAKNYYERTKGIAEGIEGAFFPMGTIEFSQLESVDKEPGYMYNIKDEFVTDDRFKEGAGCTYPAGTNVYWTADDYWDCLTGPAVTGVKGDSETDFRRGYVNIAPDNIGLGNVDNTSDADKPISTATQNALNGKQDSLGFTPVQQGGGANQGANKVYLGWGTDGSGLRVQVDGTDLGALAFKGDLGNYLLRTGGTMNGNIEMSNHLIGGVNNIWLTPYADWLTNILNGKLSTSASCNKNWNWSGQSGQPDWVWGGNSGTGDAGNYYVWNPSNFSVNYATYTGNLFSTSTGRCLVVTKDNFLRIRLNGAGENGTVSIGSSNYRFSQLYVTASSISTSDRRLKANIQQLTDKHIQLLMLLIPVSFTFCDGTSGRTHIGFIAQDVEDAMTRVGLTALDFAGFCKDVRTVEYVDAAGNTVESPVYDEDGNQEYIYSLRYEEFIALITHALQVTIRGQQLHDTQIASLQNQINAMMFDLEMQKITINGLAEAAA